MAHAFLAHSLGTRCAFAVSTLAILASGVLLATHLEAAQALSLAASHSLAMIVPGTFGGR